MPACDEPPEPGYDHGIQGYLYYGCRCPDCTKANTHRGRVQRAERLVRMQNGDPAVPHGTPGGYTNWGCHCPDCTKANSTYCREMRRNKKKAGPVTIP